VLMGFMLQFAFGALAVAGEMVGYSMKLGMAKMADPINGVQVPIVTTLYFTLGMLVLLALDIHLVLIQLLIDSFSVFPVAVDGVTRNTLWEVIGWATRMFEIGVLMSLPIVGSILLLDISMGVVQRAAPQMHIFAIGFPITLIAGLLLIWLTLPEVFDVFVDSMNEILFFIRDVLFVRT
jgi:flagellar biosynthetic protein FliR